MREQLLVSQGFATRSCHCRELGLLTRNFLGVVRPPPGRGWIHVPYVCRLIHVLVLYPSSDHFLRARRSWRLAALWGCGDADKVQPPDNSPFSERDRVSHCADGGRVCGLLTWAARLPSASRLFSKAHIQSLPPSPSPWKDELLHESGRLGFS